MATRDNPTVAALHGTAWRRATERGPIDAAVVELRTIADGRTDLFAQTAGTRVGVWAASPATHIGTELLLAGLCIYAGADLHQLEEHLRVGFDRGRRALGPVYGMDLWRRPHGGQTV